MAPSEPSRTDLCTRIKDLEKALTQLPDLPCNSAIRNSISVEIDTVKKQITQLKPLDTQVESCKALVERLESRKQSALIALHMARSAHEEAEQQLVAKKVELQELETKLAESHKSEPLVVSPETSCFIQLESAMSRTIAEMKFGATDGEVQDAILKMTELFSGLQNIAARCAQPQREPSVMKMLGAKRTAEECLEDPAKMAVDAKGAHAIADEAEQVSKNGATKAVNGGG